MARNGRRKRRSFKSEQKQSLARIRRSRAGVDRKSHVRHGSVSAGGARSNRPGIDALLRLQQLIGNQAVTNRLTGAVPAHLPIGSETVQRTGEGFPTLTIESFYSPTKDVIISKFSKALEAGKFGPSDERTSSISCTLLQTQILKILWRFLNGDKLKPEHKLEFAIREAFNKAQGKGYFGDPYAKGTLPKRVSVQEEIVHIAKVTYSAIRNTVPGAGHKSAP